MYVDRIYPSDYWLICSGRITRLSKVGRRWLGISTTDGPDELRATKTTAWRWNQTDWELTHHGDHIEVCWYVFE